MTGHRPAVAVVVDIEGTTTPVAFVYDVLFPYARRNVRAFLARRAHEPEVRGDLDRLRAEHAGEEGAAETPPPWRDADDVRDAATAYVLWLMERDRKSTGLKALQGRLWEEGYGKGELLSDVYPDVPPAFRRWDARGRGPWIFSSGSVLAQKMLFGHTRAGDLTPLIRGYFDTTTGPKKESATYRRIAATIGVAAEDVQFVSDLTAELDAAGEAGLRTAWCMRDGPAPPDAPHRVIRTFDELG
ncbi:MAG TPA: acireductone synthase [Vicinamibacteria bacterium]|nr:acireductone synthase [Vicinamibacteria bacterium]